MKSSETPFAREVAQRFATDHHERILSQAARAGAAAATEVLVRRAVRRRVGDADVPRLLHGTRARDGRADGRRRRRGVRRLSHLSALRALLRAGRLGRPPSSAPRFALRRPFPRRHAVTRALTLARDGVSATARTCGPSSWAGCRRLRSARTRASSASRATTTTGGTTASTGATTCRCGRAYNTSTSTRSCPASC